MALFITFEGIDGAGKSTQIDRLANAMSAQGQDVVITREPGGTPLAESLRELVLHSNEPICPDSETLMMFAARAQHLHNVILPALEQGKTVICSRFSDATLTYQGYGRGIDLARIQSMIDWTHATTQPDLTFILDLDPETAFTRRMQRDAQSDRFEREHIDFMHRVRDGYVTIANANSERCYLIDASQAVDTIAEDIHQLATQALGNN